MRFLTSFRSTLRINLMGWIVLLFGWILSACSLNPGTPIENYTVQIVVDGQTLSLQVPAGTTVQNAIEKAGVALEALDRLEPPGYTVLKNGESVRVIRVREELKIEEITIPFDSQTVQNESLPENRTMIIQAGSNGKLERTIRILYEDGQEVSRSVVKEVRIVEPRPEIKMVGVQRPFTPTSIPGRLVYLSGGNAWLMEGNTGNRRPLVTSGDLDGRIFSLSPNKEWLLFTRRSSTEPGKEINTLWMLNLTDPEAKPVNLRAKNIIHFADWVPGQGLSITYSTVEPRTTAPGWQANNDLVLTRYSPSGIILETTTLVEANYGGAFGWWGTQFAWSPDGALLAYAQPNVVGLVNLETGELTPLIEITPYQTRSDWAWVPALAWSPNHQVLYTLTHAPRPGQDNAETSPYFDLSAYVVNSGALVKVVEKSGMFSYPVVSPRNTDGSYQVAYLNNISSEQGDSGRYRLAVMDRDGSNNKQIFPEEGKLGLDPQEVVWSPEPFEDGTYRLAVIYQKNLFLVHPQTGEALQITGDGLIEKVDW